MQLISRPPLYIVRRHTVRQFQHSTIQSHIWPWTTTSMLKKAKFYARWLRLPHRRKPRLYVLRCRLQYGLWKNIFQSLNTEATAICLQKYEAGFSWAQLFLQSYEFLRIMGQHENIMVENTVDITLYFYIFDGYYDGLKKILWCLLTYLHQ